MTAQSQSKTEEFLRLPNPVNQDEYRDQYKQYKGKIPGVYLECLKLLAMEKNWTLEDT